MPPKVKPVKETPTKVGLTESDVVGAFLGADAPELTSVGYIQIPNTKQFVAYVIKSKGKEILDLKFGEPNLKAIVEDEAKENFVYHVIPEEDFYGAL